LVDKFQEIFRSRVPKDLQEIKKALLDKDFETIYQKAHLLSTTLSTLGFINGEKIATDIDDAFKNKQNNNFISLTETLIIYLENALTKV